jgi:hypothetical protein
MSTNLIPVENIKLKYVTVFTTATTVLLRMSFSRFCTLMLDLRDIGEQVDADGVGLVVGQLLIDDGTFVSRLQSS